jgi:predicted  nucleic acid-binding Zn-ribbon protein
LNEQLIFLVELQEIDSSILSLADKIESLPKKLEQFKSPLKEAETSFQKIKSKYDDLNKRKKNKDQELEEIQDKINKLKSRSSEIKTNKEYEAHLKEIEGVAKNKYKIEDEILSLMEDIENSAKDLQKEDMKIRKSEDDFKQQEKILEEEKKKFHTEMEMNKAKRKDFVSRIEKETYNQYMTLLNRLGGLAVVPASNEVCLGCHYNIPPQLYNDIKKNDDLYNCFYCKRFLYYKNSRETAPKA